MPDVPGWQPAPGRTLALAAELADIRVGTWVYASPVRPAWTTAWEAHSLSVLSEGRFEMGIGTGRPGIEDQLRELGLPIVPSRERLAQVRDAVAALRRLDGSDLHTPVVMAVRGPKGRALAAEVADTVTFVAMADDPGVEIARLARDFRALRDVELALHVPVVGDVVAPFMTAPLRTRPHCAPSTHWPYSPPTRRRQPRRSSGAGRRSASPTSSSAAAQVIRRLRADGPTAPVSCDHTRLRSSGHDASC